MSEIEDEDALLTRKYLKNVIMGGKTPLRGYESQRQHIEELFRKVATDGESNSALLIGPRGSGKTSLIATILMDLLVENCFVDNCLIVYLNGLIHTDDKLALASIAVQLKLENTVDGKVFGSFAENLEFLLSSLRKGDKKSKSVIFLLEEFDLFCAHHNQTLLYNLFDVSQSPHVPVCILGVTCRLDVMELLEKRVKSRFSHRQLFIFPTSNEPQQRISAFRDYLKLPVKKDVPVDIKKHLDEENPCEFNFLRLKINEAACKVSRKWIQTWNKHIDDLSASEEIRRNLQMMYEIDISEQSFKCFLVEILSRVSSRKPQLLESDILATTRKYLVDERLLTLRDLSVLEFCLIIAMKHHSEIYDRDPFNFQMIHERFGKFASQSGQSWSRSALFKAFEYLEQQELIAPIGASAKIQKDFQMYRLVLTLSQIAEAARTLPGLPTDVAQWAQSSLV
ncbi:origin recognition complex subunit 4 [Phlebotomus argentipes]|uniref:origin recognition complex subunit 4 n=1 Tax=Phlebotomus argentipes TaxID=94469 RepID=UPI002892EF83|nr:origin recognition complex subunit 4 [Phlebotomus argentipes]